VTSVRLDVVVPVLWRPDRIRRVAEAIGRSTVTPHRLTFLADEDDDATLEELQAAGLPHLVAPPVPRWGRATYGSKVNLAYRELSAPFLAVLADDVEPANAWDRHALEVFDRHPDAGVVGTNDLHNLRSIVGVTATHPVIRRSYVEEHDGATVDGTGPVMSEEYRHNYVDGELVYVARSRGAFRAAPRAILRHVHYQNGAPDDATYRVAREHLKADRATQSRRIASFDASSRGDPRARGRRALLTNRALNRTGGSESAVVALQAELRRRGADVTVWSPSVGELGRRIGARDRLRGRWELALANHVETIAGAKRHADRVVQTCHGTIPKSEQPHPDADQIIAVSPEVASHVLRETGTRPRVIPNRIDLLRYRPNRAPRTYPDVPEHVKLVSNYRGGAALVQEAVALASAEAGRPIGFEHVRRAPDTASVMQRADVIVGLGRTALEGLATGAHVVVYDARSYQDALADGPLEPGSSTFRDALACNLSGRGRRLRPTAAELAAWLLEHNRKGRIEAREAALRDFDVVDTVTEYLSL
jgi:glycosyltransferase involved in cell wall biosynthesis